MYTHTPSGALSENRSGFVWAPTNLKVFILAVNYIPLSLLDIPEDISEALPHSLHLISNPIFRTQCTDLWGHQVVVVARHSRKQTSETKQTESVDQTILSLTCVNILYVYVHFTIMKDAPFHPAKHAMSNTK